MHIHAPCFLFLWVLKCFTSPGTLAELNRRHSYRYEWSFLIRRFSDQRLVSTSPRLFAATLRPSSLLRSLGIHHTLLNFLLGNLKTTKLYCSVFESLQLSNTIFFTCCLTTYINVMSLSTSCDLTPEENRLVILDWPTWP